NGLDGLLKQAATAVGDVAGPGVGDTLDNTALAPIVGSGAALNDILHPNDLFGGITPGNLLGTPGNLLGGLGAGVGGGGLNDNGVAALANTLVGDASHTLAAVGNGGTVDGILNDVGSGAGTIVDDLLNGVSNIAGSGPLGSVLNGLGGDVVNGAVGGGGLLAGTPLA